MVKMQGLSYIQSHSAWFNNWSYQE